MVDKLLFQVMLDKVSYEIMFVYHQWQQFLPNTQCQPQMQHQQRFATNTFHNQMVWFVWCQYSSSNQHSFNIQRLTILLHPLLCLSQHQHSNQHASISQQMYLYHKQHQCSNKQDMVLQQYQ